MLVQRHLLFIPNNSHACTVYIRSRFDQNRSTGFHTANEKTKKTNKKIRRSYLQLQKTKQKNKKETWSKGDTMHSVSRANGNETLPMSSACRCNISSPWSADSWYKIVYSSFFILYILVRCHSGWGIWCGCRAGITRSVHFTINAVHSRRSLPSIRPCVFAWKKKNNFPSLWISHIVWMSLFSLSHFLFRFLLSPICFSSRSACFILSGLPGKRIRKRITRAICRYAWSYVRLCFFVLLLKSCPRA